MSVLFIFQTVLQWILISKGHYSGFSIVSAVISTVALAKGVYSIMKACCCPEKEENSFKREWLGMA